MLMDHQQHVSQLFTAPIKNCHTADQEKTRGLGNCEPPLYVQVHWKDQKLGENGYCWDFCPKDFPNFFKLSLQETTKVFRSCCPKYLPGTWNIHLFIHGCFNWMIPNLYHSTKLALHVSTNAARSQWLCDLPPFAMDGASEHGYRIKNLIQKSKRSKKVTQLPAFVHGVSRELYF